ncbi:MAG TPA: hypothetical protein VGQ41_06855 [Pyrinomonadaceae bacterium]|nr:hypothetical protein [Pyrinomonadaceae bacterium]
MRACLFSLAGRNILLSLVCWILIVVASEPGLAAHPIGIPNQQSAAVTEALQASFGSVVEAVTGFTPFYLTGDFNGDGMQDIAVVVLIKERRTALPKDVRLINPFWDTPKVTFPTNPAAEKTLALAIVHSWKTPKTATKILLVGQAPLLTFVYDRTSRPEDAKGLMELMSKRVKRRKGYSYPATAKGDVILLWTEVGDQTPLYWNGRTYKWEEGSAD